MDLLFYMDNDRKDTVSLNGGRLKPCNFFGSAKCRAVMNTNVLP